jgi:tRNA pseudouridine55 synthase
MDASAPLSGILAVDKPLRMSSMRAVEIVRRRAGGTRTGHAGTLDPLATGVLVLALGRCTREIESLMATEKRYETEIDFTAFTATDDMEGARTEAQGARFDAACADPEGWRAQALAPVLAAMRGTVMQRPPAYSAMKIDGRRAYAIARRGGTPEIAPRPVEVHSIEIRGFAWPVATLAIHCGKGFYVRSLARELGEALGVGGHCRSIRRTAVGAWTIDRAVPMDALPEQITADWLARMGTLAPPPPPPPAPAPSRQPPRPQQPPPPSPPDGR